MARVAIIKRKPFSLVHVYQELFGPTPAEATPEFDLKEQKVDENKKRALLRVFGRHRFKKSQDTKYQIKRDPLFDVAPVKQEFHNKVEKIDETEDKQKMRNTLSKNMNRIKIKVSIPLDIVPQYIIDSKRQIKRKRTPTISPMKQEFHERGKKRKLSLEEPEDLYSSRDDSWTEEWMQNMDKLLQDDSYTLKNLPKDKKESEEELSKSIKNKNHPIPAQQQVRNQGILEDDLMLSDSDEDERISVVETRGSEIPNEMGNFCNSKSSLESRLPKIAIKQTPKHVLHNKGKNKNNAISELQPARSLNLLQNNLQLSESSDEDEDRESGVPEMPRKEQHIDNNSSQDDNTWSEEWLQKMDSILQEELRTVKDLPEGYLRWYSQEPANTSLSVIENMNLDQFLLFDKKDAKNDEAPYSPMEVDENGNDEQSGNYEPIAF